MNNNHVVYSEDEITLKKQLSKELGYEYTGKYENHNQELPFYFDNGSLISFDNDNTVYFHMLSGDITYLQIKVFIFMYVTRYKKQYKENGFKVIDQYPERNRDLVRFMFSEFREEKILKKVLELLRG